MGRGDAVDAIKRQNHRACCPSRTLDRPKHFLLNLHAHPIGAVFVAELVEPAEYLRRLLLRALGDKGHHQLGGFRHRDPWFIGDTAAAKPINDEFVPVFGQSRLALLVA